MIKNLLEPEEQEPKKIEAEREDASAAQIDEDFERAFAGIESPAAETSKQQEFSDVDAPADDGLVREEKPAITSETPIESANEQPDFSVSTDDQAEFSSTETKIYESNPEFSSVEANDAPVFGFPSEEADSEIREQTAPQKISHEPFEIPKESVNFVPPVQIAEDTKTQETNRETVTNAAPTEDSATISQTPAKPESFAEAARRSGLAYAAAITLFGSIVFMLIIGWFADLLLGTSPLGIVAGIILGAAIGFFQFFRLTAQIFKGEK